MSMVVVDPPAAATMCMCMTAMPHQVISSQTMAAVDCIRGHLINYPLGYLEHDYLLPMASKEAMVPAYVFM